METLLLSPLSVRKLFQAKVAGCALLAGLITLLSFAAFFAITAVGGILTGEDAKDKIEAGASLVQILTGMIYSGPGLVRECVQALRQA